MTETFEKRELNRRHLLVGAGAGAGAVVAMPFALGRPGAAVAAETQKYASDYISFVGSDETGSVYLAHDNNRGQTGQRFFADHWVVMWDQKTGWVPIKGSAHYKNEPKLLTNIPSSDHFAFTGDAANGLSFESASNDMRFEMAGLQPVLERTADNGRFWVAGGPAQLEWNGRRLDGRVIYEHLYRNDWNRFTNSFTAIWKNFNGLYLRTADNHDFYMHSQEADDAGSSLTGRLVGYASWDKPAPIDDIEFKITESELADGGQFRWPIEWSIGFTHNGRRYSAVLATRIKRSWAWWKTGGFMMSVVDGVILEDGARVSPRKATGWGELLI